MIYTLSLHDALPICELPFPYGSDGTVRMHLDGHDVFHYGPATYASEVILPESCVVKIRHDMPLDRAALIGCSVMTGVGAVINTAAVAAGASLVAFGHERRLVASRYGSARIFADFPRLVD